ncbi:MAG: hypothetical protein KDB01_16580, partial [Planctomycetaceae bacterium]|nr:hypothetical protein [Planctomycetaceae bacterium]
RVYSTPVVPPTGSPAHLSNHGSYTCPEVTVLLMDLFYSQRECRNSTFRVLSAVVLRFPEG